MSFTPAEWNEDLGWVNVDYPNVTQQALGLTLGATSSTPVDHHAVVDALYGAFFAGCTLDVARLC